MGSWVGEWKRHPFSVIEEKSRDTDTTIVRIVVAMVMTILVAMEGDILTQ